MSRATSIRKRIRKVLTKYGNTGTHYSYADATKTQDDEGHYTISDWGTGTPFSAISVNHFTVKAMMERYGDDSNTGDRALLIRDDQFTPTQKDKIVIGSETYEIEEVKVIDPIQNVIIAYRIVLSEATWSESE